MVDGPRGRTHLDRGSTTAAASSKKPGPPNIIAIRSRRFTKVPTVSNRANQGPKALRDGGETARGHIEEMREYAAASDVDAPYSIIGENLPTALTRLRTRPIGWSKRRQVAGTRTAGADAYLDLFGKTAGGAMMARAAVPRKARSRTEAAIRLL